MGQGNLSARKTQTKRPPRLFLRLRVCHPPCFVDPRQCGLKPMCSGTEPTVWITTAQAVSAKGLPDSFSHICNKKPWGSIYTGGEKKHGTPIQHDPPHVACTVHTAARRWTNVGFKCTAAGMTCGWIHPAEKEVGNEQSNSPW